MTLEKSHELITMHSGLGSGYNFNAARMMLGKVMREYGLEVQQDIKPCTKFESAFKS